MAHHHSHDAQQQKIFGPFFATMLLTFVVWVYMYIRRIRFFNGGTVKPEQIRGAHDMARLLPPDVNNSSDNLKNLFEIPILFYAISLYLFVTKQVDGAYVTAGWLFLAFRIVHSLNHCTINIIMPRFYCYLCSCVALFFMIFRAMMAHFLS